MKITVLPVSGGGFVSQLALLSILPKVNELIFASSGGNLAAYIALAADYNIYSMERILSQLNTNILLKSWWPSLFSFIPSWVAGYSRGSYYANGNGAEKLYQNLFTQDLILKKEIWTGTTLSKTSKCQLFCNRSKHKTILDVDNFTTEEFNTMPLKYLNGNISDISSVSLASASIPGIVPPIVFHGNAYLDGGATYASPLAPMSPILRNYSELHIDYINSFDVNTPVQISHLNMGTCIRAVTTEMIHSMIVQDRSNGIEIIRNCNRKVNLLEFSSSKVKLDRLFEFRESGKIQRSFLEIYPIEYYAVEMDNYNFEKAKSILWLDRKQFNCRFWWIGDSIPKDIIDIDNDQDISFV